MSSLAIDIGIPQATTVVVTSDELTVDLVDGRTVSVPLSWYPRLIHASENERGVASSKAVSGHGGTQFAIRNQGNGVPRIRRAQFFELGEKKIRGFFNRPIIG